jgi:hypothetical protein
MLCPRCGGVMSREYFISREGGSTAQPYEGWRCISCGEVIDPLILRNRMRMGAAVGQNKPAYARRAG